MGARYGQRGSCPPPPRLENVKAPQLQHLVHTKTTKIVATRYVLPAQNSVCGRGSALDRAAEAYSSPQTPS